MQLFFPMSKPSFGSRKIVEIFDERLAGRRHSIYGIVVLEHKAIDREGFRCTENQDEGIVKSYLNSCQKPVFKILCSYRFDRLPDQVCGGHRGLLDQPGQEQQRAKTIMHK